MKTVDEVCHAFEVASRKEGHARNTRKTYLGTVREFAQLMKDRRIDGPQAYFDYLSSVKKLAPKSVWHALNPLKFLYERVLDQEFGTYRLPRRSKGRRIPCELSHADIIAILAELPRLPRLQAGLLYGCGLRIESDMPDLERQVEACRRQWEKDRAQGIICPIDSESLMRKFGRRTFGTLPWFWLFPSAKVRGDQRWHATDKRLATALKRAAEHLGITQRVNPHAFRHSYATNLLRSGVDIRTIQTQLGHSKVETTEIYAHAMGGKGVDSPLDRPAPVVVPFPARDGERRRA